MFTFNTNQALKLLGSELMHLIQNNAIKMILLFLSKILKRKHICKAPQDD